MLIFLHSLIKTILISCLLFLSGQTLANIRITLEQPDWDFLLQNHPLGKTDAELAFNEQFFASSIQPLLAKHEYKKILAAFKERNITDDSPALNLLRGQIYLTIKAYPEAKKALDAAINSMPNLALAHRSLSLIYMIEKNYNQAQKTLSRSIELGVADAQVYGQLAYVNLQLGHAISAVAGYQQALFLQPNNEQWLQGLLYAYINSHALDQAQSLVEQMLINKKTDPQLWLMRSNIALQRDKPEEALNSLEVAFIYGERNYDNFIMAAQLHVQYGSSQRAIDLLTQSIHLDEITPKNSAQVESLFSTINQITAWLLFEEKWTVANQILNVLTHVEFKIPNHYQSRFDVYRAQLAFTDEQPKQAIKFLASSLKIDPTNGEALLTLGNVYLSQHQLEQASMYFIRAQAIEKYKERALLNRAQLEIDRKSYPEGLRLLREVIKINPHNESILANISSLENLVRNES